MEESAYCTLCQELACHEQGEEHGDDDGEDDGEVDGDVWSFDDSGACFVLEPPKDDEQEIAAPTEPSVCAKISGEKFSSVPAFVFLEKLEMTQLPNCIGCGLGIHFTTNTWQIRYPAEHQKSTARTFGHVKGKGYVSPVSALVQCLLWAWKQHESKNPSCSKSKERIQVLSGALAVGLGKDVQIA